MRTALDSIYAAISIDLYYLYNKYKQFKSHFHYVTLKDSKKEMCQIASGSSACMLMSAWPYGNQDQSAAFLTWRTTAHGLPQDPY